MYAITLSNKGFASWMNIANSDKHIILDYQICL